MTTDHHAALNNPDWRVRASACTELAENPTPEAIARLVEALGDAKWQVREAAAVALGRCGEAALEPVVAQADGDEDAVRIAAINALGEIGHTDALPKLRVYLEDELWSVREAAVEAVGQIGDASGAGAAAKALGDAETQVRRAAAVALGRMDAPGSRAALEDALVDADWGVREAAARSLGQLGDSDAAGALLTRLDDEDAAVREAAANALGELRSPQALDALLDALGDERQRVRQSAAEALTALGPVAADAVADRFAHDERAVRQSAQDALSGMGASAKPQLRALLGHENAVVRETAAQALGDLGEGAFAQAVAALVSGNRTGLDDLLALQPDDAVRATDAIRERLGDHPKFLAAALTALAAHVEPVDGALYCDKHLTRFDRNSDGGAPYYSARLSDTSVHADWAREIVAVIDSDRPGDVRGASDTLEVDWLARPEAFDFERVVIRRATPRDIDRLVLVVRGDEDAVRQAAYGRMRCQIEPTADLPVLSTVALRRVFGEVSHARG